MSKPLEQMTNEELWQLFPIILREYDPAWPENFEREAALIREAAGPQNIVRLSHCGSTAVPGLTAKPTVDILMEISRAAPPEQIFDALAALGYLRSPQPDNPAPHMTLLKGYTPQGFAERVFHVHVRYHGDWDELYFRDYLRENPGTAGEYAALKAGLRTRYAHDRDGYTGAKTDFIRGVTARARGRFADRYAPARCGIVDAMLWLRMLTEKLRDTFGEMLLFTGLQGSYRRGEATAQSDLDAVVILERVTTAELRAYREIVAALPHAGKACGFVGGREELLCWPKYELFQFRRETAAFYGDMDELLPAISRENMADSARNGAAALYHALCHGYVHGDIADPDALRGAYKGAFFILQVLHCLRGGSYADTRRKLLPELAGIDREILLTAMNWDTRERRERQPDHDYALLLGWCGGILRELAE